MRVLLLNANTSEAMTEHLLAAARSAAPMGMEFVGATGRFGGAYIGSRATYAIGAHAALDAYAEHGSECDAVLLACFGDPGIAALREIASVPVIGMAEASCKIAASRVNRFSIVTGGEPWIAMLTEYVASIGFSDRLASVRAVNTTGAQIAAEPEAHLSALISACLSAQHDDGAEAVILGGAGLIGLASRVAGRVPVPVIDCLNATLEVTESVIRRAGVGLTNRNRSGVVGTTGLGTQLARLLSSETQ